MQRVTRFVASTSPIGRITDLTVYPLKSGAARPVRVAPVSLDGLVEDRRAVVIDAEGVCITAREHPALMRVHCLIDDTRVFLQTHDREPLEIDAQRELIERCRTSIWGDEVIALSGSAKADSWLTRLLGVECRLAIMGAQTHRPMKFVAGEVNFADAGPLLLTNAASLDDLNARLLQPVTMGRFRPNLVVTGFPPFAEDGWTRVRIGAIEFDATGVCDRCNMVLIDPSAPERAQDSEPMRTLATYRRGENGKVYFGQLLVPRSTGRLQIGDPVEVLKTSAAPRFAPSPPNDERVFPVARLRRASAAVASHADALQLECVAVIDETADVRTFRFRAPQHFAFSAGQFITLQIALPGGIQQRCYSLSSSPSRPDHVAITVKRSGRGLASDFLHEHMQVGTSVSARGPFGRFHYLARPARKVLMLSAGNGITPLMSMLRWIADGNLPADIVFHHSAQTRDDIPFADELKVLKRELRPQLSLSLNLTREPFEHADLGGRCFLGRLDRRMLRRVCADVGERVVFVCGPDGFRKVARDAVLEEPGFDPQNLLEENFGAAAGGAAADLVSEPYRVTFAKTGKVLTGEGLQTVLSLARKAGVPVTTACEVGLCGTCRCRIAAGEWFLSDQCADATRSVLTDAEKAAGVVLACTTCPKGAVVVDA